MLLQIPWSCSAHAKDIWTSADWDLASKLSAARWTVTCTKAGFDRLRQLALDKSKVNLSYHGLDLVRFDRFAGERPPRDGSSPADPAIVLSVGRAVPKKGYDILLRSLALLPRDMAWRFVHIGGGDEIPALKSLAQSLHLADRIEWQGPQPQEHVLAHYRAADIFVLPCRIAADGDRDGLPNVLVEAGSQRLPAISTPISGVPELLTDEENALLVAPDNPNELAEALKRAITDPALRARLGNAAETRVRHDFDYHRSIAQLQGLFAASRRA
jgi:glycosyltransferase involved in cell wall biosynthesis